MLCWISSSYYIDAVFKACCRTLFLAEIAVLTLVLPQEDYNAPTLVTLQH